MEETKAEIVKVTDTRAMSRPIESRDEGPPSVALVRLAIERQLPTEQLEQMLRLHREMEDREARRAWVAAMAACKMELQPTVSKDHRVKFESKKEGAAKTDYWHTTLGHLIEEVTPTMARHGLSAAHAIDAQDEKTGRLTVSCIITHAQGHSERTTLSAYPDESGNKNKTQAVGSALSYLRRYTLMAALGLASSDEDDDGAASVSRKSEPAPNGKTNGTRELSERAKRAISSFKRWNIDQRILELTCSKPATEWDAEDFDLLGKKYDVINKTPEPERISTARDVFGLEKRSREPGEEG